ncbi:MAG: PHP domain-containing protein [Candidatus Lernaella stagnicola]|nr:PHP domain-containing protein [Candidatus Lernaella stagnicola]
MTPVTGRIDLHAHTTASDGSDTPRELVQRAKDAGLDAVAITDHDTIDGVAPGLAAGLELDLEVVPGVELSTDFRDRTIHVLGYYIDPENEMLAGKLDWARRQRETRNDRMIDRFHELGIDLTLAEVEAEAGGSVVGRPHFAKALLKKGVVATPDEAFREYLGNHGKAYLPKVRFDAPTVMGLIRGAGGLPVFAHPVMTGWKPLEIDDAVSELIDLGLAGLEVFYTFHNPTQVLYLHDIAERRGLLMTGGSDFHGAVKPDVRLGFGRGDLMVPSRLLDDLKRAANRS